MNKVFLIGRLTKDPEARETVTRYTVAVDRYKEGADFINCVAFGNQAEFAEKYLHKGIKIAIEGHIQTGSYEKDGKKVYTTNVVVDRHEFCEKKGAAPKEEEKEEQKESEWMDAEQESLPFL